MNELVKIKYSNDEQPTVSGRELHNFLEVDTPYRIWFPRMCEYGFTNGVDYTPYNFVHPQNKQETQDHQLAIPMAKELCMIQRTDKGKMARQYFLQVEEAWNTPAMVMARAIKMAEKQITQLSQVVAELKPKAEFADRLLTSEDTILIGELAKILSKDGFKMGERTLFSYLRDAKILTQNNLPYQRFINAGYFEVAERPINTYSGTILSFTTKVTPKGQHYIYKRLKKEAM
jgi:anti-repressor protein